MLVLVYTCQNATLLEITCHGSYASSKCSDNPGHMHRLTRVFTACTHRYEPQHVISNNEAF